MWESRGHRWHRSHASFVPPLSAPSAKSSSDALLAVTPSAHPVPPPCTACYHPNKNTLRRASALPAAKAATTWQAACVCRVFPRVGRAEMARISLQIVSSPQAALQRLCASRVPLFWRRGKFGAPHAASLAAWALFASTALVFNAPSLCAVWVRAAAAATTWNACLVLWYLTKSSPSPAHAHSELVRMASFATTIDNASRSQPLLSLAHRRRPTPTPSLASSTLLALTSTRACPWLSAKLLRKRACGKRCRLNVGVMSLHI